MDQKIKWLMYLAVVLIVTGACNLFSSPLGAVDDVISEVENLADQVPIDEIQEQIETLGTDLPTNIDEIQDNLETLATDIPSGIDDIGDIGGIGDIGDIGDIITEGLGSDDVPADIPLVDAPRDDLLSSKDMVSYLTTLDFDSVLAFYQEQMPKNDWAAKDGSVITDDAAVLYYEKPNREATITLSSNPVDGKTAVMIIIQAK